MRIIKSMITLACFGFISNVASAQVEIIAHRGSSFLAPENTVAAAKLAWEEGTDAVELDMYLSKDNQVVVIHDGNTKRVSGELYKVKETDSETLRKLDVGSWKDAKYKGEKIPFMYEIINTVPAGKKLVVELKSHKEVIPYMKKVIDESGKLNQMVFICFDWETIVETKKVYPNNPCYWLCGNKNALLEKLPEVAKNGLEGVDLSYSIIDEEVMAETKKLGLDVIAYTVDDPNEAKRLIKIGVIGITTNRPGWLKTQIN